MLDDRRQVQDGAPAHLLPQLGIGGIMDHRDALQFLLAGACAVQVGTFTFTNPRVATQTSLIMGTPYHLIRGGDSSRADDNRDAEVSAAPPFESESAPPVARPGPGLCSRTGVDAKQVFLPVRELFDYFTNPSVTLC